MYKEMLINAKLKTGKRVKETGNWEKYIMEAKDHIGL
jgi:hypothetical protein